MTVSELRQLAEQGKHEQVVAAADATIAALPPAARMLAWRIDYAPKSVERVLLGAAHAYLFRSDSRGGAVGAPWEVTDRRPAIAHDQRRYDGQTLVTCIDLATGNPRWSRRFDGFDRFMIDPRNDDLWAMESQVFQLGADKGDVKLTVPLGGGDPSQRRGLHGVRVDNVVITHERDGSGRRAEKLLLYDVDAQRIVELPHRPGQFSPNRLRVLVDDVHQAPDDVTNTVALATFDRQTKDWTYATPGYSANDPVWMGNNVLVLSGMWDTRGAVTLLDGGSGVPRWITVLPRGAYSHTHVYLPGNSHLEHTWDAVGALGDDLVGAIGGRGELFLLDLETGGIRGQSTLAPSHFQMPRRTAQNLIVMAGTNALIAAPLEALLGRGRGAALAAESEAAALVLKGRSLLALGREADARAVAERLTRDAPDSLETWRFAADVADVANDAGAAVAARIRAMELGGTERDEALLKSHGLLARIDTGPITAALLPAGPIMYVGTLSGQLMKISVSEAGARPRAGAGVAPSAVIETQNVPQDIASIAIRGNEIYRRGSDRKDHLVAALASPPPPPDPRYFVDPMRGGNVPPEWTRQMGYDGAIVNHRRRLIKPLNKGHVRILDGDEVTEHQTTLPEIESWNIYLGPGGPLGFGSGGIYRLDAETLVPTEKLIDSGSDRNRPHMVHLLAGDGETLCFFSWRSRQPVLQLWTRDGKTKLREEPASSSADSRNDPHQRARLVALRDGYLFAGDELIWLPRDPARPTWRFARWPLPRPWMRHHNLHDYSFGPPCVIDDEKIFAPCRDGGVFVFDVQRVTEPQLNADERK